MNIGTRIEKERTWGKVCWRPTKVAQQSLEKHNTMTVMNSDTPEAATKLNLLFNRPALKCWKTFEPILLFSKPSVLFQQMQNLKKVFHDSLQLYTCSPPPYLKRCLSVCHFSLSICLSFLFIYLSVCHFSLSICLSLISLYLSVCLSLISLYLSLCLSLFSLSVCLSLISISLSIDLYVVYVSVCLSVCLSIYLMLPVNVYF